MGDDFVFGFVNRIEKFLEVEFGFTGIADMQSVISDIYDDAVEFAREELARANDLSLDTLMNDGLENNYRGNSKGIKQVRFEIRRFANSEQPVLILGKTGSGKDMVARNLCSLSSRNTMPFRVVNCAALSESLLESELFGHSKGSFTGADRDREGLLTSASGGTIFLDEVGEMSPKMQAILLRFLENQTLKAVGSDTELKIDVRVIAATNRPLRELLNPAKFLITDDDDPNWSFRSDLYHRLASRIIDIPTLHEREKESEGEVVMLAEYFLNAKNVSKGSSKQLSDGARKSLREYALREHGFPGNIRELKHIIEGAVIQSGQRHYITTVDLFPNSPLPPPLPPVSISPESTTSDYRIILDTFLKTAGLSIDIVTKFNKEQCGNMWRDKGIEITFAAVEVLLHDKNACEVSSLFAGKGSNLLVTLMNKLDIPKTASPERRVQQLKQYLETRSVTFPNLIRICNQWKEKKVPHQNLWAKK
ncbi:MAG: sigma 54-interacting transcriptional regulator [Planctomycetaceae bacterium]|nr:sigma 54-interacting transcriptional regulator [Planctomycetaceae bacterium]